MVAGLVAGDISLGDGGLHDGDACADLYGDGHAPVASADAVFFAHSFDDAYPR